MNRTLTPDELMQMTDEQNEKPIPREWHPFYPGKEMACPGNWTFYLQEGESRDIRKQEFAKA